MSNLVKRVLTGTVFGLVLIGCIVWSQLSLAILFLVIIGLGIREFFGLMQKTGAESQLFSGLILGAGIFLHTASTIIELSFPFEWYFLLPFVPLTFIFELFRKKEKPFLNIASTLLGPIYIALPFSFLFLLSDNSLGKHYEGVLAYFFLLWSSDSFAYFVGSAIGKTKLFERISPGKTWEGSIGGLICTLGLAFGLTFIFPSVGSAIYGIAVIVVVFGTLGDLTESMFKRSIGVKDSGNILPGHGGILDRFDGVFISAPMVYFYLAILAH